MNARHRSVERTCIVTRQQKPAGEMLRFVCAPDGKLVFDLKAKLPGRGVWLSATRHHLAEALKKKSFAKAFRCEIGIDPDFADNVERQLKAAALGALGMATKAGLVVTGFRSVDSAVRKGKVLALIQAQESSEDGRRKINNAIHATEEADRPVATLNIFTSNELSLALGRSNVVHAAAMVGQASENFLAKARSAVAFCTEGADTVPVLATGRRERSVA